MTTQWRPKTDDFRRELRRLLDQAQAGGLAHLDVRSGDLHRSVGGYPGIHQDMATCCAVMQEAMRPGDSILKVPPRGRGANLIVRYHLPR